MPEAPKVIDDFRGEYDFLSNFYMGGGCLPSVEHQFQAAKATDAWSAIYVMSAPTPKVAKARGRGITLRDDWEEIKLSTMEALVDQKFGADTELGNRLLATGDAELVEGNWWGDTYWGVCRGKGENKLGKILMVVRDELRSG